LRPEEEETKEGEEKKVVEKKEGEGVKGDEVFADAKVEEEPDVGLTLEDYMASKKKSTLKKEARKPEELKKVNIEHGVEKVDKISTISSHIKNQEVYNASQA